MTSSSSCRSSPRRDVRVTLSQEPQSAVRSSGSQMTDDERIDPTRGFGEKEARV